MPKQYKLLKPLLKIPAGTIYTEQEPNGTQTTYVAFGYGTEQFSTLKAEDVWDSPDFFELVKPEPLYPVPAGRRTYSVGMARQILASATASDGDRNSWKNHYHAEQKATIDRLSDIVVQNRLNLLHEQWEPRTGVDYVYYVVPGCSCPVGRIIYQGDGWSSQKLWKTREQAEDEASLMNALHDLKL